MTNSKKFLKKKHQQNKGMIMMSFMWQNKIMILPKGSSLANYIMGYLLGKNYQETNYMYARISFNKEVTAITKKM